jgi:SAM-dependent methyltransferase
VPIADTVSSGFTATPPIECAEAFVATGCSRWAGHAGRVNVPAIRRYGLGAPLYDVVSMERLVYRAGRVAAISCLSLRPGDRVLDVGCGTGLNFGLLTDAVGRSGEVVGVDASAAMLRQARRRIADRSWANVSVVKGDAASLEPLVDGQFDAVLFTYSLAVITDWREAWLEALGLLRAGGRVVVADTALPVGWWRLLRPVARLALFTGGVDASRQVWNVVLTDTAGASQRVLKGGHIHVAAGTKSTSDTRAGT